MTSVRLVGSVEVISRDKSQNHLMFYQGINVCE